MLAVVCDSSPLVYLSRLEQFCLLRLIYDAVLVPPAVWQEVAVRGEGLPESDNLKAAVAGLWMRVEAPADKGKGAGLSEELGEGEMEAIILAREQKAILVTDDRLGRTVAESLGLEVTGTLGVLIRAKQCQHVAAVKPLLDRLKHETNFRMTEALYNEALKSAGEIGPASNSKIP